MERPAPKQSKRVRARGHGYSNFGIKYGTREAVNSSGTGFGGALAMGRYCVQQMAENGNWDEA